MNNKVLLMILDGWGNGRHDKADVISTVHPEYISAMTEKYPHAELRTDGENVGLPDGQMGNSEVGHLNIGAGRVVYQDLVKINRACRDNSIMQNPEVKAAFEYAKKNGVNVHFMGLVSDGGVHSSLEHLFKLCDIAAEYKIENTFVHCFMDGRDTDPRSGKGFVADLEKHMAASTGKVATVIGRYYAMDRDKRWERVKIAYDALVDGVGEKASDMVEAVQKSYDEGVTDEFIKPVVRVDAAGQPVGMIRPNDLVIFFNYRNDRAKELTIVLTQEDMPAEGMHTMPLYYCCMTPYDAKFTGLHILFDKENVPDTIGEWVSKQGLKQLRIAETEKYAHVTFFLNGGREEKFDGEERILVASPKVATYDLQPEMSAPEVAEKLVAALGEKKFDFICLNFANGDMVGHTGVYEAIVKAVKAVDKCVSEVVEAARANGYEVVMIADHGNADNAVNADGTPNTAHSLNPVPIVVVSDRVKSVRSGILADGTYGQRALNAITGKGWWIGRPIELPSSRPLRLEHGNIGSQLIDWPLEHVVKCLVFYHPDDPAALRAEQDALLLEVWQACNKSGHELLLEVILPENGPDKDERHYHTMLEHFYQLGIKPDWWKLPPLSSASWQQITALIEREDPWSRGILILGLDAPSDKLRAGFAEAAAHPMIKGFAVGRTIFGQPSRRWMQGELSDEALIEEVKRNYLTLIGYWREARR